MKRTLYPLMTTDFLSPITSPQRAADCIMGKLSTASWLASCTIEGSFLIIDLNSTESKFHSSWIPTLQEYSTVCTKTNHHRAFVYIPIVRFSISLHLKEPSVTLFLSFLNVTTIKISSRSHGHCIITQDHVSQTNRDLVTNKVHWSRFVGYLVGSKSLLISLKQNLLTLSSHIITILTFWSYTHKHQPWCFISSCFPCPWILLVTQASRQLLSISSCHSFRFAFEFIRHLILIIIYMSERRLSNVRIWSEKVRQFNLPHMERIFTFRALLLFLLLHN